MSKDRKVKYVSLCYTAKEWQTESHSQTMFVVIKVGYGMYVLFWIH